MPYCKSRPAELMRRALANHGHRAAGEVVLSLVPLVPSIAASAGASFARGLVRTDEHTHPSSVQWFWDGAFFVNENFDIADVAYKYVISGIWTGDGSNRLSIVSRDCPVVGYRLPIPINIVPTCRQIDP